MRDARFTIRGAVLPVVLWSAIIGVPTTLWAGSDQLRRAGSAEAGRSIFNGKGVCYYCHGVDGDREKLPTLEADTAALIARLTPPPADLRNPKSLRLKTDQARAKVIREGHEGTGMFPDTRMTDQELADTLAYLALLRQPGMSGGQAPRKERRP
jgi:mono/diheme cytochrome c family protein